MDLRFFVCLEIKLWHALQETIPEQFNRTDRSKHWKTVPKGLWKEKGGCAGNKTSQQRWSSSWSLDVHVVPKGQETVPPTHMIAHLLNTNGRQAVNLRLLHLGTYHPRHCLLLGAWLCKYFKWATSIESDLSSDASANRTYFVSQKQNRTKEHSNKNEKEELKVCRLASGGNRNTINIFSVISFFPG